mmetsp:Transcript_10680/g.25406  ORF Transcript_10680/g.25406 Transcript_10680/m.25406 type:complete len:520 (-) Transcript_10680:53-1612(-)
MKLFLATCAVVALGDVPNHCLMRDVAGMWTFEQGPAVDEGHYPSCGHTFPNTAEALLKLDVREIVPPATKTALKVNLTETVVERDGQRRLLAVDEHGNEGFWTMVFDTAMEVRIANKSFYAPFLFSERPGQVGQNGDRMAHIAEAKGTRGGGRIPFEGDIYTCHCDATSSGWWSLGAAPAYPSSRGCFFGRRDGAVRQVDVLRGPDQDGEANVVVGDRDVHAENQHDYDFGLVQVHSQTLPKNFDWKVEMLKHAPFDTVDPLTDQDSQGACGSCYAFAATTALAMRFRIAIWKKHGKFVPVDLSWRAATRCSPMTEGCKGGFAFPIFRFAHEQGVPASSGKCEGIAPPLSSKPYPDTTAKCDWNCYKGEDVFYAKDYGYVGGFTHVATEQEMMKEIFTNGPIVVALATGNVVDFKTGNDGEVMTRFRGAVPKEKFSTHDANATVHAWRYTTHSILATGFGEDEDGTKYWVVRNSWGKKWGDGSYGKMLRGTTLAAMESRGTWVEPDLDRLPASVLQVLQ